MTAVFVPKAVLGALGFTFRAAALAALRPSVGDKTHQALAPPPLALVTAAHL